MGDTLTALTQRLEVLEKTVNTIQLPQELSSQSVNAVPPAEGLEAVPSEHVAVNDALTVREGPRSGAKSQPREPQGDWLTTGGLYQVLKQRGFTKSGRSFRRLLNEAIKTGELPAELKSLGVEADIKIRREASPQNNTLRWLRLVG